MNFKDSLKRNDYNTLSIIIFSIHTLIFYFIFMIGREGEREGGREEREKEMITTHFYHNILNTDSYFLFFYERQREGEKRRERGGVKREEEEGRRERREKREQRKREKGEGIKKRQ